MPGKDVATTGNFGRSAGKGDGRETGAAGVGIPPNVGRLIPEDFFSSVSSLISSLPSLKQTVYNNDDEI